MRAGRLVAIIVGALLALPALVIVIGGATVTVRAAIEQRDDGYFDETLDRLSTDTAAITSVEADLEASSGPRWLFDFLDVSMRLKVNAADAAADLFVGIGPADDVYAFLSGVARDEVSLVGFGHDVRYRRESGGLTSDPPGEQEFWVAATSGTRPLTLEWDVVDGDWVVVLMNGDGSSGILADVKIGVRSDALLGIGIAIFVIGALLLAAAVAIIVAGARSRPESEVVTDAAAPRPQALDGRTLAASPVRVEARIDSPLSPWRWLVKWLLAIPHLVVLAILWLVSVVLTLFAAFAILFTGKYPRGIFDFNVGVMRWSWRVVFYAASGGLGTDRYPRFTTGEEPDYPATLDIAYPGSLSRGLVLVKWWLLAIPHYLVLAFMIGGGIGWWWNDSWGFLPVTWAGGLLGILVLIAAVTLLFTGRYPEPLFDLIIGLNRWAFRVFAYAALMTDVYPPFRLDQGGREPVTAADGEPPST